MTNETYTMLEEAVQTQLSRIETLDIESKEGRDALTKSIQLAELLITTDRDDAESHDKQERRRIEEERNKAMNEVEREKQKITLSKAGLEMAKVVVPLMISFVAYNVFQKRVMKFEETGRVTSTAGKELHLPRFMK